MSGWIRVCSLAELPPGAQKSFDCGVGEPVALFHIEGRVYALSDVCPHQGGRLSQGYVQEGAVYCPWHEWRFALEPSDAPPNDLINHYPVKIKHDAVYIAAPLSR
ncbi:MAG TPA: Rieske 2Fe-2S domain-containing protein [Candidatus Hydrogenedentes bacterium]|nr:Rieske 2Fe-2S domain-containing protein [Candidatus Hydrogenedentota bacterium]